MSSNTHNVPKENTKLFAKINLLPQIIAPQKKEKRITRLSVRLIHLNYIFMYKLWHCDIPDGYCIQPVNINKGNKKKLSSHHDLYLYYLDTNDMSSNSLFIAPSQFIVVFMFSIIRILFHIIFLGTAAVYIYSPTLYWCRRIKMS